MCGTSTDTSRIFSGLYGTGGVIAFGASNSANNQAELAFNYIAAGSSSNSLALGLWGGPVMTMLGTGQTTFVGDITMQKLVSNNATTSTSSTTGSVLVSGGIAISNTTEAINSTNGGSFTTAGGMAIAKSLFVGGNTIIASNLSVNGATTTIAGNLNVNGTQTSLTNLQASDTVITGFLSSNNNTNTTGLGSGAITTTGGAAISKDVHIGGALMLGTSTDNSRVISSRINGVNSTIAWGSDNNANNQAELIFNYVGAGYTANNLGLGFWGVQCMNIRADRVCNFLGTGQVANGTASVVIAGGVSIGRALQYESQSRKIVFLSSGSQLITPAICSNTYIYIQTPTGGTLTMDSATNFIAHAGGNTAPNPNPNNFEYGCILENRSGGLVNLVGFGVYTSISNTACVKFTIHLSLASGTVLVGGITLQ